MLVGIIIVALTVLICVYVGKLAKEAPDAERFGIRFTRIKHGAVLSVAVPCKFKLTLGRETKLSGKLGKAGLFADHKTGDVDFDKRFAITALRDDVLDVLRKDAALRKSLLQFAERHAGFSELTIRDGRLSVTLQPAGVGKETVDAVREDLAEKLPALTLAFGHLPANTSKQASMERAEVFATVTPLLIFIIGFPLAAWHGIPLATGERPWLACVIGAVLYGLLSCGLIFALTKEGPARRQGAISTLLFATMSIVVGMPDVVSAANAISASPLAKEVVTFRELKKYTPRKGSSHYYLHVNAPLVALKAGGTAEYPTLEIGSGKHYLLERAHLAPGSRLEIEESEGLLGLPFVSKVTVLPEAPGAN